MNTNTINEHDEVSDAVLDLLAKEAEQPVASDRADWLLSRDLRLAAENLTDREARYLVDTYYQMQEDRIRAGHQKRTAKAVTEPHAMLTWLQGRSQALENSIKAALQIYARHREIGRWALSIHGIGPVVTAGLLANIDITKAPTVGHVWRFAGVDPTQKWLGKMRAQQIVEEVLGGKGKITDDAVRLLAERSPFLPETFIRYAPNASGKITRDSLVSAMARRPWNASLKRLVWIIGGLFVRLRNSPNDIYGRVYEARKAYEQERNEAGAYADLAAEVLRTKNIRDASTLAVYTAGKLTPGHIEQRVRRYTAKLFLAAFHEAYFFAHYKRLAPKPYVIEHMGHAHYFGPPHTELISGWREARIAAGM